MASPFSLTAKFAIVTAVLFLLSLGLCGLGGTGVIGQKATAIFVPAGLACLGLAVLGILATVVVAIVQAVKVSKAPGPTAISSPPPPDDQTHA